MGNGYNPNQGEVDYAFSLLNLKPQFRLLLEEIKGRAGSLERAEQAVMTAMSKLFDAPGKADQWFEEYTIDTIVDEIRKRIPVTTVTGEPVSDISGREDRARKIDEIQRRICGMEFRRGGEEPRSLMQMASHISDMPDRLIRAIIQDVLSHPDAQGFDAHMIGSLVNQNLRDRVQKWERDQWGGSDRSR